MEKGIYKFEKYQSLGDENVFTLDLSKIPDKQINFYGIEELYYVFNQYLYVSQENSKILVYYAYLRDYEKELSPIYVTADS